MSPGDYMRSLVAVVFLLLPLWGCSTTNDYDQAGKADVIVILAGNYQERTTCGARLYRLGYAGRIILVNDGVISRWSTRDNRNLYQIEWAEEELVKIGVPRDNIVKLPFYGSSTMFDALAVKRYVVEHKIGSILLVTSDYHARRALWAFRKAFSDLPVTIAISPASSSAVGVKVYAMEMGKTVYYWIRFGLLGLMPDVNERNAVKAGSAN